MTGRRIYANKEETMRTRTLLLHGVPKLSRQVAEIAQKRVSHAGIQLSGRNCIEILLLVDHATVGLNYQ
jgi:hypothetical protein